MKLNALIKPLISGLVKRIEQKRISTISFTFEINDGDFGMIGVIYIDPDTGKPVQCTYDEFEELIGKKG